MPVIFRFAVASWVQAFRDEILQRAGGYSGVESFVDEIRLLLSIDCGGGTGRGDCGGPKRVARRAERACQTQRVGNGHCEVGKKNGYAGQGGVRQKPDCRVARSATASTASFRGPLCYLPRQRWQRRHDDWPRPLPEATGS